MGAGQRITNKKLYKYFVIIDLYVNRSIILFALIALIEREQNDKIRAKKKNSTKQN